MNTISKSTVKINIPTILFICILLVFIFFAANFAVKLQSAIIPDEVTHFTLSQYFSTTLGIPHDVPETYAYGYIGHKPSLYYWINGRVINVLSVFMPAISPWKTLVLLRLLNVFYSVVTVIFCYLLAKEIIEDKYWQLLAVFFLTNTLMFVFLSGGVNYDNLVNLCCFASIYFLIRVFNKKALFENSLGWLIFISAGTLVKITVLPLALIMTLTWVLYLINNRTKLNSKLIFDRKTIGLLIILFMFLFLNISIYGVNILKYQALTPPCNQILTQQQCDLSPFVERANQFFLPEKLTGADILSGNAPDPVDYFLNQWIGLMLSRVFGILGHKNYFPVLITTLYRFLLIFMVVIVIRYWKKPSYTISSLIAIFIFYVLVLFIKNYDTELITGFKHFAVQGRYIFPVIGISFTLIPYYLSKIAKPILRKEALLLTVIIFLWGGPLLFFARYSALLVGWFY